MTISPSLRYNHELMTAYMAKAGNLPRYPPVSEQADVLPLDTAKLPPHAYNPSIYRDSRQTLLTYRYDAKGDFTTRIGIAELGDGGTVMRTQDLPIDGFSVEDARLFSLHGEPWLSWVEAKWEGQFVNARSVVKYAQLELPYGEAGKRQWKLGRVYQPAVGGNDWSSVLKNWCFFEAGSEDLFFVFISWPDYVVCQIQGETVVNEYKTAGVRWPYGPIRGGNIIPWHGQLLRVFHSSTDRGVGQYEKRYYVGALAMEPTRPFNVAAVVKKPILFGSELPRIDCHHFKAGVAFPCGLIKDTGGIVAAVGVNDAACALVKFKSLLL